VEIVKGLHKIGHKDGLSRFLAILPTLDIIPLNMDAAIVAGRIYADLERAGKPIGRADPMIAAIAIQHGSTLVTGNTAHFRRIQSLGYAVDVDDWRT